MVPDVRSGCGLSPGGRGGTTELVLVKKNERQVELLPILSKLPKKIRPVKAGSPGAAGNHPDARDFVAGASSLPEIRRDLRDRDSGH
jgi:hypothetical protein